MFPRMLLRPLILAVSLWAAPSHAQVAAPEPIASDPSAGLAQAFAELRAGSFTDALDAAARSGPVARDVIEWLRLREGQGSFDDALSFLTRNPDWPGLDLLRRRAESNLPDIIADADAAERVLAFFDGTPPATGQGTVALVQAYQMLGREGDAEAQAALAWVERSMTSEAERWLLSRYAELLEPLEPQRMEQMFWDGADVALRRAIARDSDTEAARVAQARLSNRVPDDLEDDPGVRHHAFRQAMRGRDFDEAQDIILSASTDAEGLGRPQAWARDRRDLARRLMRAGEPAQAYAVASSHWLESGSDFADLEWLSGFLSLRRLDQPERAVSHFRRFATAVETPISLGRAGYWTGRALEAAGREDEAQTAYGVGAQFQTSFYGLLAAERLGLSIDSTLTGREPFPPFADATFRGSTVFEAGLALLAAGERDLGERFLTHLTESLERPDIGTLANLVLDLGEPHVALLIAKRAARAGLTLPRAYFPVVELGVENMPVSAELALAIARRESEFDPGVTSGVGAQGLMQLMPGTAQDVARALSLPYQRARLYSDPSYNATLGTGYLAGLIDRFGDNPVLVSAGYNAGPGRPASWIGDNGDPRDPDVDVVDWIEMIPFDETRNYVMRVAESIPVYRARLSGEAAPLEFTELLKGR
ncbi:soluble lytic murein transglycosylase [Palleronia salina]|uniref:Soluble lytic murein transglycosylase n=2 Tax=Palleronia salina TaxID=313368 RepID=A0A1M6CI99_9RHOB|nr:soluble lytic murein transglycosylase [Palleronia salina]